MRVPVRRWVTIAGVAIVVAAGVAAGRAAQGAEPGPAERAVQLAQEMAADASRRDVKALEKLIPQSDRAAYVSNGHPISGKAYAATLGQYYDTLQVLDFHWDKWETFAVGDRAAVFTGWASVRTVDKQGKTDVARALFTMVFADDGGGWKRVIAQKWQSQQPAVSAIHAAAADDRVPPGSALTVHFQEPVTTTPKAFQLDCAGTTIAVTATAEPPGDGGSFLVKPAHSLPLGARCTLKVVASEIGEERFGQKMAADAGFTFTVAGR